MIQFDLFAPLPPLPEGAVPLAPVVRKAPPAPLPPAVIRPLDPGTLVTIGDVCRPVNNSLQLPSGEVEVSFRIENGVWWVTRLLRKGGAWFHRGYPGGQVLIGQPLPDATPQIRMICAERLKAVRTLEIQRECGDPEGETLALIASLQKRLYTLKGGRY